MASGDATAIPVKNQAYRCVFPIVDADGDLVTGATGLDSEVSKDQGTFADATSEATEIATSSGIYYLDLTATEMNADCVAVIVKTTSSGAKTTVLVFYPQEAGDINVDVTYWNGTAVATPTTGGVPEVDVTHWLGTAAATPTVAGVPEVDLTHVGGATTNVAALATNVDAILTDTSTTLDDLIDTEIATLITEVGKIPKSDGTSSWNATALAAIQSEANDALVAYDPPTRAEATTDVNSVLTVLGTPAGASISADILVIDNFVDGLETTIGAAGAGLTAVPWNAAWDAEVQSEVDDALVAQRLDELLNADSDIDGAAPPTVGSVVHELMSKTAGSFTYDQTTDSLEAIRDKETDIETDTAEIGAAGAGLTALASAANLSTVAGYLDTEIAAILADTNELQTDWANGGRLDLLIDAIKAVTDLLTAAHSEPTGVPAADETPLDKLAYLYMALRNKVTVTASKKQFFDDGGTAEWEKDLSDDGTTYTETEGNAP